MILLLKFGKSTFTETPDTFVLMFDVSKLHAQGDDSRLSGWITGSAPIQNSRGRRSNKLGSSGLSRDTGRPPIVVTPCKNALIIRLHGGWSRILLALKSVKRLDFLSPYKHQHIHISRLIRE